MKNRKLILASGSPRRKWLLREAGLKFTVKISDIDESVRKGESGMRLVSRLSREKAFAIAKAKKGLKNIIILAADTVVMAPGGKKILGKPESVSDAKRMLRALSGRTHVVLTGYAAVAFDRQGRMEIHSRVVKTHVSVRTLDAKQIQEYLDKGESMDKAGAYAAQGYGMSLIRSVNGSFTNVVGLPLAEVLEDLRHLGLQA